MENKPNISTEGNREPLETANSSSEERHLRPNHGDLRKEHEAEHGISYKDLLSQLEKVSQRLSEQVRTLALGIIAFSWALLVGDSAIAKGVAQSFGRQVLAIGGLAVASLFFDFLQYVTAYWNANSLRKSMEDHDLQIGQFNYRSSLYILQYGCFVVKQTVLFTAAVWLIVRIFSYLRTH